MHRIYSTKAFFPLLTLTFLAAIRPTIQAGQQQTSGPEVLERIRLCRTLSGEARVVACKGAADFASSLRYQEPEAALGAYRELAQLQPNDAQLRVEVGNSLRHLNRFEEAVLSYREAIRLAPKLVRAYYQLGTTLNILERSNEAIEPLQQTIRLNPNNALAHGALAGTLFALDSFAEAIAAWDKAVQIDPGYFDTRSAERETWEYCKRLAKSTPKPAPTPAPGASPVPPLRKTTAPKLPSFSLPQASHGQLREQILSAKQIFQRFSSRVVLLKTLAQGQIQGLATGLILSPDGFIATNAHVIKDGDFVEAVLPAPAARIGKEVGPLPDSTTAQSGISSIASLRYFDVKADIAILKIEKIEAIDLLAFELSGAKIPQVGERVYAIGNPRGLERTITEGIVSGIREADGQKLIQHSAAISPGSSGGALLNESGALIGMNTFLLKDSQNIGFAIPLQDLMDALTKAKAAAAAIPFPGKLSRVSKQPDAIAALRIRDYLRAIDLAKSAIKAGENAVENYCIIGISYFELDQIADAEIYLKQAIVAAGEDSSYKQSARYYLARVRFQQYVANPSSSSRATLANAAREFLKSSDRSILTERDEAAFRDWAQSVLTQLTDISGDWTDLNGELFRMFVRNDFQILKRPDGNFNIRWLPHKGAVPGTFGSGILVSTGGIFTGNLTIGAVFAEVNNAWSQQVAIKLELSEDYSRLIGTASYGPIRGYGDRVFIDGFREVLPPITVAVSLIRR